MTLSLSHTAVASYLGDVLPLHLGFDSAAHDTLKTAEIRRESDSDAVALRTFSGDDAMRFNHGVLLILQAVGHANVTATPGGVSYVCTVTVRAPKTALRGRKLRD